MAAQGDQLSVREATAVGWVAFALRCFPPGLRREYGAELIADFRLAFRDQVENRRSTLGYSARVVLNVIRTGLAERWRTGRQPAERRRRVGTFWQDVRYGARTLLRNPGFASIAALTLALGIGANAAIFSVIDAVLLRPLPFREPDRLFQLSELRTDRGWEASFTHANFWDVRDMSRSFDGIAALASGSINLTGFDYPERLRLGAVSADFFQVLGISPVAGRTFARGEDEPGSDSHLVVLSHRLWTTRFGGNPATVGRTITLNGEGYLVIGVLPPGEPWLNEADVFLPLIRRPDADRGSFELAVIGRIKPGVSAAAAQDDLNSVAGRLAQLYKEDQGMGVRMRPASSWVASDSLRRALWILLGAVGFLLLIACVNLANLFLARGSGRTRERALRAALGASRGRIVRQVLTESLLVSVSGAGLGLVLAFATLRLLRGFAPEGIPRLGEAGINLWVLGFTALTTLLTALLAGTLPAVQASHADLLANLREGERNLGGGRLLGRLRGLLVALEVAASLALLIGAGLLLRSFGAVLNVDRGFATEHRMFAEVALPNSYDGERVTQFIAQVRDRLGAEPGVTAIAAVSLRPLEGIGPGMGFAAADKASPSGEQVPWASWRIITGGYFATLGIPLLRGRDFNEGDIIAKPWRVIVSRRLAQMVWPGEDAVGRTLILWKGQSDNPAEVIGVAGDTREWGLADEQALVVYLPYYGARTSPVYFVVNTDMSTSAMAPVLRTTLLQLDPSVPLARVESMEQLVGDSVASRRFIMLLLVAFSTVAVLLALAGVYGVISYSVSRRTAEIGVRLAMGASQQRVLGMIVRQGMAPVVTGLGVGVALALALTRLMTSLLFGVRATDVLTYVAVAALLGIAALVACYLPARQAMRVDVVSALRQE